MEAYVLTKPLEDLGKRLDMALALTGASGVGKSTCVAKIASLLRLNFGIPVRIASLRRPGEPTPDILLTVGRLLEVSVDMIDDIKDVNECARKNAGSQKLLLDIGMPEGWLRDLRSNMAPILALCPNIETQLILSGSTKPEDLENLTRWSQTIPASAMGFTKLDETESLGCVFETARKSRMPLSFFSIGRRIPEDLLPATAAQLTEWITDDWSAARNDAPPA
ncbi:MAG: hypothetical protein NTW86_01165 [Candidatus Sumerlaeota bacterium]|nr:hypothetical protein [Candidatus Sumerlaeota bacterium]